MPLTKTHTPRHLLVGAGTILAGLAIAVVPATAALAHAQVESSIPKPGQVLQESPAEVLLVFNEPVSSQPDQVKLLDSLGKETPAKVSFSDTTTAQGEPSTAVTITPSEELGPGTWVTAWSAVSADGHIVSGLVDFTVQVGGSASGAGGSQESAETPASDHSEHSGHTAQGSRDRAGELPTRVLEGIAWLAGLAAGMLLAGSLARRWVAALAGIGTVAAGVYAFSLAVSLGDLALAMKVGEVRAAGAVLAAGAVSFVANGVSSIPARRSLGAVAAALFALQGLWSGHHLLVGMWPITIANVTHLAAAAAWIGAVLALSASRTMEQARRTRTQATVAVAVLIPSAVVTALWTSGIVSSTFAWSGWATILSIKLAAVLAALAAGLLNHRALGPNRIEGTLHDPERLRRFLRLETAAIVATVAASAVLTLYTPADISASASEGGQPVAAQDSASPAECSDTSLKWPDTVALTVSEGKKETLTVTPDMSGVSLELPAPAGTDPATGSVTIQATHTSGAEVTIYLEPGQDAFTGPARLPLAGHWMLEASIPVDAFTTSDGTGHVDITSPSCVN